MDVQYEEMEAVSRFIREIERYEEANEISGTYVFEYDSFEQGYSICASFEYMFPLSDEMLVDQMSLLLSLPVIQQDRERFDDFVKELNRDGGRKRVLLKLKCVDDKIRWFKITAEQLNGLNNQMVRLIVILQDVNSEMLAKRELEYRSTYDSLTQLYNQETFYEKVVETFLSEDDEYALICMGIDNYGVINDRFGPDTGKRCVKYLSKCIKNHLCWGELGCRFSDEGFMVLRKYKTDDELIEFTRKLTDDFDPEEAKKCGVSLEFGIYKILNKDVPVQLLADRSQLAKKCVKGNRDVNYCFYNDKIRIQRQRYSEMESEMEDALKNREFLMYLQPKISLVTGKIYGAEALVRWNHKGEFRMPNDFLPIFEENGFIKRLDEYMWNEAAAYISKIQEMGYDIPVSVNISRYHITNTNLEKTLNEITARHGIENKYLELEITETLFIKNIDKLYKKMSELKNEGFVIEMDDFGSGYSSLNMLREAPVDVVKIDKYFMDELLMTRKGEIVVENIVRMLKQLGILVIAEGVEKKDQVDFLKSVRCDVVQGFYYSKPIPADDFTEMLKNGRVD